MIQVLLTFTFTVGVGTVLTGFCMSADMVQLCSGKCVYNQIIPDSDLKETFACL